MINILCYSMGSWKYRSLSKSLLELASSNIQKLVEVKKLDQESQNLEIKIHNGRKKTFSIDQMIEFDNDSIFGRFYDSKPLDTSIMFEQLGDWVLDFTNAHIWAEGIPDIDPQSARIFTLWAEDPETGKILGRVRGFFVLIPLTLNISTIYDYYSFEGEIAYYPMAIISSFRTTYIEEKHLDSFLEQIRTEISFYWKEVREDVIKRLPKESKLWKRYVYSFPEVIHFTILCPAFDREMIRALNRIDFKISGVMQIFSSPSPLYDEAIIKDHLLSAQKTVNDYLE